MIKVEEFTGELIPIGVNNNDHVRLDIVYLKKDGSSVYFEDCKVLDYKISIEESR